MSILNDLVYDIGLHDGNDTKYYLHKGYRVVAVDANPLFIKQAEDAFKEYIAQGKLTLLNIAIADEEGTVSFNISEDDHFSSMDSALASRGGSVQKIAVQARKISSIFAEHGIPYYCKIDIEGYDSVCLKTFDKGRGIPTYTSAESVAEPSDKKIGESEKLEILNLLHGLGYTKFKLIDQHTLSPLQADKKFYTLSRSLAARGMRHIKRQFGIDKQLEYRKHLQQKHGYSFVNGASGPFGEDLGGEWYDYHTAKAMILRHMHDHYSRKGAKPSTFWCDWHAKK